MLEFWGVSEYRAYLKTTIFFILSGTLCMILYYVLKMYGS